MAKPIDFKSMPKVLTEQILRSYLDQRCPNLSAWKETGGMGRQTDQIKAEIDDYNHFCERVFKHHFPRVQARLERLFDKLDSILEEVCEVFPDANYYAEAEGFNLMIGDTHDSRGCHAQQEMVGAHVDYPFRAGGWDSGGW